jgi:hypothetical protein
MQSLEKPVPSVEDEETSRALERPLVRRTSLRHASEAALVSTDAGSATGFGTWSFRCRAKFVREAAAIPSIVVSLDWLARTGNDGFNGEVPTGGGFNVLQAGATALHRHDPPVYYAGLSYAWPRAQRRRSRARAGQSLGRRLESPSARRSAHPGLRYGPMDFRVTGEVPNFRLSASLPIRF